MNTVPASGHERENVGGKKNAGARKRRAVSPLFSCPRSVGRPRCSRAGCGSGNRIRGDAQAQAGRKAGAGRGTRPEGATAPEGADRDANDKRLRRAERVRASAMDAWGASGTSLHHASAVTDAVRWMMLARTLWVASETVGARARASLIASAVTERWDVLAVMPVTV